MRDGHRNVVIFGKVRRSQNANQQHHISTKHWTPSLGMAGLWRWFFFILNSTHKYCLFKHDVEHFSLAVISKLWSSSQRIILDDVIKSV